MIPNWLIEWKLLRLDQIKTFVYHKWIYLIGGFKYNFSVLNNYSKLVMWVGWFALGAGIVILNFLLKQCTILRWTLLDYLSKKFFYSASLTLFLVQAYPFSITSGLELSA